MKIIVTNLKGKEVACFAVSTATLASTIKQVKSKYPPGKYHATLLTR